MRRALENAARGWGQVAPNPLVGAVVVRDGEVVGEGHHTRYGEAHAEVEALRRAGGAARGGTMYVTLEPCAHHGKTPPCTEAVIAAGIRRLVYACADPNPKARGGADVLREAGVAVEGGILEAEAGEANAPFLHAHSPSGEARPWIALKLALSLDAMLADPDGRSGWITGPAAREEVHRMRAGYDAVAVGVGTVVADDPLLTVRGPVVPRRPPARIVFDRSLRTPTGSRLVRTAAESPVWLLCAEAPDPGRATALEREGVRVLPSASMAGALAVLRSEGIGSLFCEGGAGIAGALLGAEAVDRLLLFYAPLLLGGAGRAAFAALPGTAIADARRWRHLSTAAFGPDTLITLASE